MLLAFASCKKTILLTQGGQLKFSVDTLMFDTVFTTRGSATFSVKIYNPQNEKVIISSVKMRNGENSYFRLNINGKAGTQIDEIELAGNDSIWVFAAVTIDPTDENTPFLTQDQLVATLNGKEFSIPFIAYGQNAHYIDGELLGTQTLLTDKPYCIINNAWVDAGAVLTIPAGARLYFHQQSRLFVAGTLKVNGTLESPVTFLGDRIDPKVWIGDYIDLPGQWGGLYFFSSSSNNSINYAVIKNGGASTIYPDGNDSRVLAATIQVDSGQTTSTIPKLRLTNTVIHSSAGYGIVAFQSHVYAENCRITQCGAENIMFFQGGKYRIFNSTIATEGTRFLDHSKTVTMAMLNYLPISQNEYRSAALDAEVKNCIVHGSLVNEVYFDKVNDHAAEVKIGFSMLKTNEPIPAFVATNNILLNQDPMFVDSAKTDYHLLDGSPARHAGTVVGELTKDLDGITRNNPPSIGCYE